MPHTGGLFDQHPTTIKRFTQYVNARTIVQKKLQDRQEAQNKLKGGFKK